MPTGEKNTNIYNKVLLGEQKMGAYFLTFLKNMIADMTQAAFLQSGVLDADTIGLGSTVNDTFTLDLTNADRLLDGAGNIVDLSGVASSLYTDYPFENATASPYYAGIQYQSVPTGAEPNPRTGEAEYPYDEDTFGELGEPDSVADNTTFIRLVLDGILETSVDHSGRPVRVYLDNPVSPVAAVAFYDGTVVYSVPNNYVDIPYTPSAGPLGQHAPFTLSLTAADYRVHVKGVSWFKNTDLRTSPNYAFIGIITGNGPAAIPVTFDITDQRPAFLISLDRAYRANSPDTPAPGRTITVDKWAVRLTQTASTQREQDPANMALRIDKLGESITGGIGLSVFGSWQDYSAFPFGMMQNAADAASGGDLQPLEDVDLVNPGTITFNRGAVDFTTTVDDIIRNVSAVWITGTTSNAQDGLYIISSIASINSMTVTNMDGTSPAFSAESNVNARVMLFTSGAIHRNPFSTTYSGDAFSHLLPFYQAADGLDVQLRGAPQGDNLWARFSATEGDSKNNFCSVKAGRIVMRGGGEARIGQSLLGGLPQFAVDKVDIADLNANWQPAEFEDWGFDYRGDSYGKEASSDDPAFALAGTFRAPSWNYNGGAQEWDPEEPFTQFAVNILTLTGAGDLEKLMGDAVATPQNSPGSGWFLVEVRYSGGDATDGIYLLRDVDVASTRITLMKLDGTAPAFPSGSGNVRIFGGSMAGPIYGPMDTVNGWMHQITAPTPNTGGLRIGSGWGSIQFLTASVPTPPGLVDFYIKGGQTFATALTTRQATVASLPAAGVVESADGYPGDLHLTTTGPDNIRLPATLGSDVDRILREGGGTWTYDHVINKFRGFSQVATPGNEPGWDTTDGSGNSLEDNYIAAQAGLRMVPLTLPQGCTLNSISVYMLPIATSFALKARRQQFDSTASVDMYTGGDVNPPSTVLQTLTLPIDQNNSPIDNETYEYRLIMQASTNISPDIIYGIKANITVTALGHSWFKAI